MDPNRVGPTIKFMKAKKFIDGRRFAVMAGSALAAGFALEVAATPYDGVYRLTAESDCARVGDADGALRIEDNLFQGIESECQMTRPVDVVDMDATLYTMECKAEGENWIERAMLMKSAEDDGLIMLWNGYAFRYDRCPDGEEDVTETAAPDSEAGERAEEEIENTSEGAVIILPQVLLPQVTLPRIELDPAEDAVE